MSQPVRAALRAWARQQAVRTALILLLIALSWDGLGGDLWVMHRLGDAQGFPLKGHPLLSVWLHDRGKQLAVVLVLLLALGIVWPWGPYKHVTRRQRAVAVLAVLAAVLTVSWLKHFSLTSCPWELQIFGGVAQHVSHWQWGVSDGGGGRCFPGGHASAALGLMSASLPLGSHERTDVRQWGRRVFWLALLTGLLFGGVQTLRGAHYPSHTLWTACICWTVGLLVYGALRGRCVTLANPTGGERPERSGLA